MSAGLGAADEDEDDSAEDFTDDFAGGEGRARRRILMDETSPSVVRTAETFEDESF